MWIENIVWGKLDYPIPKRVIHLYSGFEEIFLHENSMVFNLFHRWYFGEEGNHWIEPNYVIHKAEIRVLKGLETFQWPIGS